MRVPGVLAAMVAAGLVWGFLWVASQLTKVPLPLGFAQLFILPAGLAIFGVPLAWGYAGWRPRHWGPFAYGATFYGAIFVVGGLWKGITFSTRNYGLNAAGGLALLFGAIALAGGLAVVLSELGRLVGAWRDRGGSTSPRVD